MRRATTKLIQVLCILSMAFAIGACSKKTKTEEGLYDADTPIADEGGFGDSDSGTAEGLQTVNYAYDSSALDSSARQTLDENAEVMKEKSNLRIQIEGHCDERGGIQYNLALGERRAKSAKRYLQDKGVSGDRISVISYGKEKPIDPASNEEAWAKNRRANFRITEK